MVKGLLCDNTNFTPEFAQICKECRAVGARQCRALIQCGVGGRCVKHQNHALIAFALEGVPIQLECWHRFGYCAIALWAVLVKHLVVYFGGGVIRIDELAAVDANEVDGLV